MANQCTVQQPLAVGWMGTGYFPLFKEGKKYSETLIKTTKVYIATEIYKQYTGLPLTLT